MLVTVEHQLYFHTILPVQSQYLNQIQPWQNALSKYLFSKAIVGIPFQECRLPTCHQPVGQQVAVALLGWQGKCYGRVSHLTFHGFLSELHHPHISPASAAEFPGPGYKDMVTWNLLWFRVDSHSSDRK